MARKLDRTDTQEQMLSDGRERSDAGSDIEERSLRRRAYLRTGAAVAAALSATGVGSTATTTDRHGIEFHRVLDAVEDLGMDPTGNEPVDEAIAGAGDSTLIRFPNGTYRFDGETVRSALDGRLLGLEGRGDEVTFLPGGGHRGVGPDGAKMDGVYLAGVDIGQAALGQRTEMRLRGSPIIVESVGTANSGPDRDSTGNNILTIRGTGDPTTYEMTVDGQVDADDVSAGYNLSGVNSEGVVESGAVSYTVDGRITDFRLDGTARVSLNGNRVDPGALGSHSRNRVAFDASAAGTAYTLSVGTLYPNRPHCTDVTSGNRVSGTVTEGTDTYPFDGAVESLSAHGKATLSFGGDRLDAGRNVPRGQSRLVLSR